MLFQSCLQASLGVFHKSQSLKCFQVPRPSRREKVIYDDSYLASLGASCPTAYMGGGLGTFPRPSQEKVYNYIKTRTSHRSSMSKRRIFLRISHIFLAMKKEIASS